MNLYESVKNNLNEAEMQSLFDIVTDNARKHDNYAHYSPREVDSQDIKNIIKGIKKKGGREVKPNVYVLEDFIYDLNGGITIFENNEDDYKVEPIKEAAGMSSIVSAEPNYTGGGIYVYTGKLKDGNYFMASDEVLDKYNKAFAVRIVNEDPDTAEDPNQEDIAWFPEWQEPRLVKDLEGKEALNFTKEILNWIISNKPNGNYQMADMKGMLDFVEGKSDNIY